MLKEMEHEVVKIKQNLKVAQKRKKSHADNKRTHKEFKVGDHVYIRVNPKRSSLRMGTCAKLSPQYYGPFKFL
jgi:ribosomal protein L21E